MRGLAKAHEVELPQVIDFKDKIIHELLKFAETRLSNIRGGLKGKKASSK